MSPPFRAYHLDQQDHNQNQSHDDHKKYSQQQHNTSINQSINMTTQHVVIDNSAERSRSPKSSEEQKRLKRRSSSNSGTYFECGRHSNQWLFGNISLKDTAKGLLKRKDSS